MLAEKFALRKLTLITMPLCILLAIATFGCASTVSLGGLRLSSSSLAFGSTTVGSTALQTVTVSNAGSSNVTISGVSLSGPGFAVTGAPTGSILAPGQSASLSITFGPASTGSASGSVTIATDVAGSAVISLSGAGKESTRSVTLQWGLSASSSVSGYNVYRAASSGAEVGTGPINGAALVPGDVFTDWNVVDGATYYYQVAAVDSANGASSDSNEASVVAP